MFNKYQHIERFGTAETEGIEFGECYLFPKIDGTNAQLWFENGRIRGGSRTRTLSLLNDNQGFLAWAIEQENIRGFFEDIHDLRLYGEWLVPHTLRTYRENAWRKFYVFDVAYISEGEEKLLPYSEYKPLLDQYGIEYIPPIAIIKNPSYENLVYWLDKNNYLIEDGKGAGEGIVIKNYSYRNKYGRQIWAKIVRSEFKEKHVKTMGAPEINGSKLIEEEIVSEYLSKAMVEKVKSNIENEAGGWQSKHIPRLLNTVYYDLIREESWNFLKAKKFPTVNFKTLQHFTNNKIKEHLPEIF